MDTDIENIKNTYDTLKRMHESANKLIEIMKKENEFLKKENEFLKLVNLNANKNVEIQKNIVINSLQSSQEKHDRDYKEICDLKKEICDLKNK
jgi:hypothetical protein